eukprot:9357900-Prorocentrum_lima.AAC.1
MAGGTMTSDPDYIILLTYVLREYQASRPSVDFCERQTKSQQEMTMAGVRASQSFLRQGERERERMGAARQR